MADLNLSGAIRRTDKGSVDFFYGGGNDAYPDLATAYLGIPTLIRNGKVFGVITAGEIAEYWWNDASALADGDEIPYGGGGSGGVQSVTGDLVDNTDPSNPVVISPLTTDEQDAIDNANAPDASNPFATIADISGGCVPITTITYADLLTAIGANGLNVLGWYEVLFQLTHTIPNTTDTHTAPVEPILIQAIATNKLADFGYSQSWKDELVYYSVENNQDAVLGCTKGYVKRRVNTKWNIDLGTDYRNNVYRRWALKVTALYDKFTPYSQYDVVKDISGAIYGSLVNSNLDAGLADENAWVNLGYNNGEYWSLDDTALFIANFAIPADAADFEDYPMLDPTNLAHGNYYNFFIEQKADYTGSSYGVDQLLNFIARDGSSLYSLSIAANNLSNFTMSGASSFSNLTISGTGGGFGSATMNNGSSWNGAPMNNIRITDFVMNNSSFTGIAMINNTFSEFVMSSSSFNKGVTDGSALNVFVMSRSSFTGITMDYAIFNQFVMASQDITNLEIIGATISTFDPSIATIMFETMTKTITSRQYGTPRLSYIDNTDTLIITDINA